MIALCYADLSSRFTQSGAAWLYSYNAFGRFSGYELGIFTWFLGCTTLSAEVVALLTILKSFLPIFKNNAVYISGVIFLILLFSIINFFGRSWVKIVITFQLQLRLLHYLSSLLWGPSLLKKLTLLR